MRVPLLLRAPGVAAGRTVRARCGLVDVAPTILELAGVEPPADLDGLTYSPQLRDETDPGEPQLAITGFQTTPVAGDDDTWSVPADALADLVLTPAAGTVPGHQLILGMKAVKGAGESGVAGSLPSGVSAVLDALSTRGVTHLDLPMTPQRIWAAVEQARAAR